MVKQKISNLIAAGRIEEALQFLLNVTEGKDDSLYNELIIISSQINANNRRSNSGLLDYEAFKLSENRIVNSLLKSLSKVHKEGYFDGLSIETLINRINSDVNKEKLKVLFIASNPVGTTKFQLEKEYLGVRKIFKDKRKEFEIIEFFDTKLDDLFEYVQKEEPNLIHISAPSSDEYLYLHNEDNSISKVPYKFLSSAFLMFRNYTNCVFVNTWTSPIFLKKISKSLNYSIGSNGLISDEISIYFSSGFYTGISMGKNIEESFKLGIDLINNTEIKSNQGLETLLLFKNGYCQNKEDIFPERFPAENINSESGNKNTEANNA